MPTPLADSLRWWETRRIAYNILLGALAVAWIVGTWPHFQPAFRLVNLGRVLILALIWNAAYFAAYAVDIPMLAAFEKSPRKPWRFPLWLTGTLFALFIAHYWIGDEIYPSVDAP